MSDVIERLEKATGTSIGGRRESRVPFHKALTEGVSVPSNIHLVTELRAGRYSGRLTLIKVDLNTSDTSNPSKKDKLYRRIATEGVSLRTYVSERGFTHKFSSNNLVEEISQNLRLRSIDVRQLLRAMRADLVVGYPTEDNELNRLFIQAANQYLWANTEALRPSKRYPALVRINEQWNRKSPITFYQAIYGGNVESFSRMRSWIPYELEVMQRFYEGRTIRGVSQPTLFDSLVFKSLNLKDHNALAELVRAETGILIDEDTVTKHRNVLVYGQPTTGLFENPMSASAEERI